MWYVIKTTRIIRETFQYVKQVGYVLLAREVKKTGDIFIEEKSRIILFQSWLLINGENKGQINMNPESNKRFLKKKLWGKNLLHCQDWLRLRI